MPESSKAELQRDAYSNAVAKLQALRTEVAEVQRRIRFQIERHYHTPQYCKDTLVASDRRRYVQGHAEGLGSKLAFCLALGDPAFEKWRAAILRDVLPRLVPDASLCEKFVGVPGTAHWTNAGAAWADLDGYLSAMLNWARLGHRHQHRELDHQKLISRELERQTKEKQRQASTLVAFLVPAHAGWPDVSIRFTSDFQIQAKIRGQPTEARTYADLGFEVRRGKPDVQWRLLAHFVRSGGVVESHLRTGFRSRNALQKGVQKLRQRLKKVFGLDDDPIEYDVVENCYRAKFQSTISISTDVGAEF